MFLDKKWEGKQIALTFYPKQLLHPSNGGGGGTTLARRGGGGAAAWPPDIIEASRDAEGQGEEPMKPKKYH